MRKLVPLVAAMAVFACDAGVSGTYDFVAVNDQELPATVEFFGTSTLMSGSLTLSDATYSVTITLSEGDGDPETGNESGTFTIDESNIIHFTPGPESEDDEPSEATWDGDEVTILLSDEYRLVFRR